MEDQLFDELFDRARELSDDTLQTMLIGLKLLTKLLDDMPGGHPGCIVATAAYQDRLFNADLREANLRAIIGWWRRFRRILSDVAERYPPHDAVDLDHLADMVIAVIEGRLVVSRALGEPAITAQQVMLLRSYIRLLFAPKVQ